MKTARRRRRLVRFTWLFWLSPIVLVPAVWAYETSGPSEMALAEVIETERYPHRTQGQGAHSHVRAILLIEGRVKTSIERGDQYRRGEQVKVWVRRGRITGRPRFLDLARPGETADWEGIDIPPLGLEAIELPE